MTLTARALRAGCRIVGTGTSRDLLDATGARITHGTARTVSLWLRGIERTGLYSWACRACGLSETNYDRIRAHVRDGCGIETEWG